MYLCKIKVLSRINYGYGLLRALMQRRICVCALRGLVCSGLIAVRQNTAYIFCNGVISIHRLLLAVFVRLELYIYNGLFLSPLMYKNHFLLVFRS